MTTPLSSPSEGYERWSDSGPPSNGPAATMALGAAAGLVLAYLYLTDDGRRLRARIDPFLDGAIEEMRRVRGTADKARRAWREGQESLAALGSSNQDSRAYAEPRS